MASYEGRDAHVLREPAPASDSPMVRFLQRHPPVSSLLVSHVRLATHGVVSLANTQPFVRRLGGRTHVFAHNGHVPAVAGDDRFRREGFEPVGTTDSEVAFAVLLSRLARLWAVSGSEPTVAARREVVETFARELATLGPANFIYSDGDALFAHGHRRTQPDKGIRPPGLFVLCRSCPGDAPDGGVASRDGIEVTPVIDEQHVVLFASTPLTPESWRPLEEGEVLVCREGRLL